MDQPKTLSHVWLDFEGTGIDPALDPIWEVAVICTDVQLRELAAFTSLVRPTEAGFARIAKVPEVIQMHSKSGLYEDIVNTPPELLPTLENVEDYILHLIDTYAPEGAIVTLAGSGVSHYDKLVIKAQMPRLDARLTYHSREVGTPRRDYIEATGHDIVAPLPEKIHRAEADIRDDLRHARAFRDLYITSDTQATKAHPIDRALNGLALVEAFSKFEPIDVAGVTYPGEPGNAIQALLRTTSPTDVVLGLLDVASDLLRRTAGAEGTTAGEIVDHTRGRYLQAITAGSH